jgi:hypothetical protein
VAEQVLPEDAYVPVRPPFNLNATSAVPFRWFVPVTDVGGMVVLVVVPTWQ